MNEDTAALSDFELTSPRVNLADFGTGSWVGQHLPWLESTVKNLVLEASKFTSMDGADKETWCVDKLDELLEAFDDKIPLIGAFLDWPFVDAIEKKGVQAVVRWAFGLLAGLGAV